MVRRDAVDWLAVPCRWVGHGVDRGRADRLVASGSLRALSQAAMGVPNRRFMRPAACVGSSARRCRAATPALPAGRARSRSLRVSVPQRHTTREVWDGDGSCHDACRGSCVAREGV